MYDFVRLSLFGIVIAVLVVFLRSVKPEFSVIVSVCGICIILISVVSRISNLLDSVNSFLAGYSFSDIYVETIVKVCGISFVCSVAAETCRDSGSAAVAATVETTGRICVVSTAMPLAISLTEKVIELINTNVF